VKVVEELDKILAFNNKLISLKNHTDAASFACGVGPVSVLGLDPKELLLLRFSQFKFLTAHFLAGSKAFVP
jgi:hypothetical protein